MFLSIDTSAGTSVAVVDRERGVLTDHSVTDTMRHAEVIGTLIERSLSDSGADPGRLTGVAAGMGPGPFTGLRVGIAAARVFAMAADLPLVPVVSHDAIAFDWYASGGEGAVLVVTDARRRERYWSMYSERDDHGLPIRSDGPGLSKPDDLPAGSMTRVDATSVSAARLGMLAELMAAEGLPLAADQALYLRTPDVTPAAGRKRVTG